MSTTEAELRAIGAQLGHPSGEAGVAMGETMNRTNSAMVLRAIDAIDLQDGDRILELGHGRCAHLGNIISVVNGAHYHGLEISELMHRVSVELNTQAIAEGKATFGLFDGQALPLPDASVTKIFTVNTLYFWADPAAFLGELHRVLAPGGRLCVVYAWQEFMRTLPFTRHGFTLYDDPDFIALVERSPFGAPLLVHHSDQVESKTGEQVLRRYTVATLVKRG